ncbi:hypothetical protein [Coprococcus sp. LG101-27]|uniref:hypothetical protein n=1 Tax=Coprococcus sp. LG101-27 TaxID=2997954 RepID=UPI0022E23816|nr:hypothetical protein [Coprococcus sp. LG101-27]
MAIELATKYSPYVDEIFKAESKKSLLTNDDFDWTGAHTIKVYKIGTAPMNDYDRAGTGENASRYGKITDLEATTQTMLVTKDRSFTFVIDKLDSNETGGALEAATALARQLREVVIPEVDAYTYGKMCEGAGTKPAAKTLDSTNIYNEIISATTVLDDNEVNESGRVLLVVPAVYQMMKDSEKIVLNTNIGDDLRQHGVISNLDGMNVVKVSSKRVPKNFGFMVAHPCATVTPTKLADYRTHQDPPGISGTLTEGRISYDAHVLDNKKMAIYYQERQPS